MRIKRLSPSQSPNHNQKHWDSTTANNLFVGEPIRELQTKYCIYSKRKRTNPKCKQTNDKTDTKPNSLTNNKRWKQCKRKMAFHPCVSTLYTKWIIYLHNKTLTVDQWGTQKIGTISRLRTAPQAKPMILGIGRRPRCSQRSSPADGTSTRTKTDKLKKKKQRGLVCSNSKIIEYAAAYLRIMCEVLHWYLI